MIDESTNAYFTFKKIIRFHSKNQVSLLSRIVYTGVLAVQVSVTRQCEQHNICTLDNIHK